MERRARVSEVTLGLMRIDQMGVSEVVELIEGRSKRAPTLLTSRTSTVEACARSS